MSFVANPEQITTFLKRCSSPSYSQNAVSVEFTTTKDFIRTVIPPTLELADTSTGLISISTWESNVCGSFELSSVSVRCRSGGIDGYWVLHLIVSSPFAIVWGRETWGEVKREGTAKLHWNGHRLAAFAKRKGVRLIEFEATFTQDLPPEDVEWFDFEAKAFPNAKGDGLESDPKLITLKVVDHNERRASGEGKLTLRGTKSDPLHTIPISSVGRFLHVSGPTEWEFLSERRLCSSEEYLPYFVVRHYEGLCDHPAGIGLTPLETSEEGDSNTEPRSWLCK
jgi:hypothetical protein